MRTWRPCVPQPHWSPSGPGRSASRALPGFAACGNSLPAPSLNSPGRPGSSPLAHKREAAGAGLPHAVTSQEADVILGEARVLVEAAQAAAGDPS
jgi:hypothetical protein